MADVKLKQYYTLRKSSKYKKKKKSVKKSESLENLTGSTKPNSINNTYLRLHCESCDTDIQERNRYHCIVCSDLNICESCYMEEKRPKNCEPEHKMKIVISEGEFMFGGIHKLRRQDFANF